MRATAFCLLEHNGNLLLQEFWHEHDHYYFYRPPGGGIENGERAAEAMRRELHEELDVDIPDSQLLGVVENIFDYGGETKHEIVFLFRATVRDKRLTSVPELQIVDNTFTFRAVWHPLDALIRGEVRLYPEEVQQRLAEFFPEV